MKKVGVLRFQLGRRCLFVQVLPNGSADERERALEGLVSSK